MTVGPYPGRPWPIRRKPYGIAYERLRAECETLECLIEADDAALSVKDRKRLDKAVTAMKIGFKILKKVARKEPQAKQSVVQLNDIAA